MFPCHGRGIVDSYQFDSVACAVDLRFRLDEYVAASPASFTTFRLEEGGNGAEVGEKAGVVRLVRALLSRRCCIPAFGTEFVNGFEFEIGISDTKTLVVVCSFVDEIGFCRGFFAVCACAGVQAHNAGKTARRVVVYFT